MTLFEELFSILPSELRQTIDAAVASGRFEGFSDVLLTALHEWQNAEIAREAHLQRLRAMIEEADKGATLPAEEVFAELRDMIAARQARLAAAE